MLIVVAVISLVILALAVALSVPVAYSCRIVGAGPFRVTGRVAWGGLIRAAWDYAYGEKPTLTVTKFGKTTTRVAVPDDDMELTDADVERAAKAIEDEADTAPVDVDSAAAPTETPPTPKRSWKKLIFTSDFLAAFFTYAQRVLYHSRVRSLRISGSLGLGQPHTTGMAAGAIYAIVGDGASDLSFNYLEEDYHCTVILAGHIYPIVCLYETICFAMMKPVRPVIAYWRKGGEAHG